MQIQCPHCGRRFTVSDGQAARVAHCPGCQKRVGLGPKPASARTAISEDLLAAPPSSATADVAHTESQDQGKKAATPSAALDPRLLDLPPAGHGGVPNARLSNEEVLAKLKFQPPAEHTDQRQLPWPIDIFLYPLNPGGLINVVLIVSLPVLLTLLQKVVFLPFLGLFFFLAKLAMGIYAAWYWSECTSDSAEGGIRAPQVFDTSGYWDKLYRVLHLLPAYLAFVLPAVLYAHYTGRRDVVLWLLVAWGVVFFPMGLLAIVLHEGFYVLNPFFLVRSIGRTFVPYLGLLFLIAAQAALFGLVLYLSLRGGYALGLAALALLMGGYSSLIIAHLLGRFYWRYSERLDWDL